MQSLLIVLSAVPVPTVASVVMAPPAHAEAPATGDVVFEYNFNDTSHNGNWDHNTISLRHDDGTTVTVSTILDIGSEKSFGAPLAISPDGSKIAFISDLNNAPSPNGYDPADLYVINSDGSGLLQLDFNDQSPTAPHFYDKAMTWSPDSTELVFQRYYNASPYTEQLWKVKADGSEAADHLSQTSSKNYQQPAWSPDGTMIAYLSSSGIETMDPSGDDSTETVVPNQPYTTGSCQYLAGTGRYVLAPIGTGP